MLDYQTCFSSEKMHETTTNNCGWYLTVVDSGHHHFHGHLWQKSLTKTFQHILKKHLTMCLCMLRWTHGQFLPLKSAKQCVGKFVSFMCKPCWTASIPNSWISESGLLFLERDMLKICFRCSPQKSKAAAGTHKSTQLLVISVLFALVASARVFVEAALCSKQSLLTCHLHPSSHYLHLNCWLPFRNHSPTTQKLNMFWELCLMIRPFSSGRNTKLSTSSIFSTVNSRIVGLVHLNSSAARIWVASIRIRVTSKCDQETFWKKLSILYNGSLSPG